MPLRLEAWRLINADDRVEIKRTQSDHPAQPRFAARAEFDFYSVFPRPEGSVTMRVRRFVRLISRANVPCGHSPERSSS